MKSNYRVVKETMFSGKRQFVIEISVDEGCDGWGWSRIQGTEFRTLAEAKQQIVFWRDSEIRNRKEVWTEILDTRTNKIVNL